MATTWVAELEAIVSGFGRYGIAAPGFGSLVAMRTTMIGDLRRAMPLRFGSLRRLAAPYVGPVFWDLRNTLDSVD
jgi:hypothetical protein